MGGIYDYWSKEDWIQHCNEMESEHAKEVDRLTAENIKLREVVEAALPLEKFLLGSYSTDELFAAYKPIIDAVRKYKELK